MTHPSPAAIDGLLDQRLNDRHLTGRVAPVFAARMGDRGMITMRPRTLNGAVPSSPILDDMNTIWDIKKFATARTPVAVGRLNLRETFSQHGAGLCNDMPIKFPGTGYRVPVEGVQFAEALQTCIDFEHAANPDADRYYAYLTTDQRYMEKGQSQRGVGLHSDSVQGPRIQPKRAIEHTYLCADSHPTLFFAQPFFMDGYDENRDWLNAAFERQARLETVVTHPPYTVSLLDAYSVHSAVPVTVDGVRTLFRLIYSVREFDRLGNTHNALFDYDWPMQPRPVPQSLQGLR